MPVVEPLRHGCIGVSLKAAHLHALVCPECVGPLVIASVSSREGERVLEGALDCGRCGKTYAIRRGVPRFVERDEYTAGFGLEWSLHARTQYDGTSGAHVSEERFFDETRWPRRLDGQSVLEVGSGSGRFTEHAAATGAFVVSVDRSDAVDANYRSNGNRPNVLIVQGDIYCLPVRRDWFDKVFCFGVLQHTPDVARSFRALVHHVRPGGQVVVDVYRKRGVLRRALQTKRWLRPITRRLPPAGLYKLCRRYVSAMWPVTYWIGKLPRIGRRINYQLLVMDYRGLYPLDDSVLKEWAVLDTFDTLSPAYDQPQTLEAVRSWCDELRLVEIDVRYGHNGIEARSTKPVPEADACA